MLRARPILLGSKFLIVACFFALMGCPDTGVGTPPPSSSCPPPGASSGSFSIVGTTPCDQDTNVALSMPVTVTFNQPVDTGTLSGDIQPFTSDANLQWSGNNTVLMISLEGGWTPDTTYKIEITLAFDGSGNMLSNPLALCFSTGATLDCPQSVPCQPFEATDGSVPTVDGYTYQRPFAADSVWNTPIVDNPPIASDSGLMIARFAQTHDQFGGMFLGVNQDVVPIYFADAGTPRFDVPLSGPNPGVPAVLSQMPIPAHAIADCGFDKFLVVHDTQANRFYELWQAEKLADGSWRAITGNSIDGTGSGIYPGDGTGRASAGVRASGGSLAAGMIFPQELKAGQIQHAIASAYTFTRTGGPVAPFTSSDGANNDPAAIPMGSRLQLDPSLDLDTLGLQPYERTIAEALQTYGLIIVDTGGGISLTALSVHSFEGNPYAGLLPDTITVELGVLISRIPPLSFRILAP